MKRAEFSTYFCEHYQNAVRAAVEQYVQAHGRSFFPRTTQGPRPDEYSVKSLAICFVSAGDLPGGAVEVYVDVDSDVEAMKYYPNSAKLDRTTLQLTVVGTMDLLLSPQRFFATDVIRCDDTRLTHAKPLSNSLVPILSKTALETAAEHFLRVYCPEALRRPMALDANHLAESMGLTVQSHRITSDGSVFGRIYFYDGEAEFYDDGKPTKTPVAAGTICTDPDTFFRGTVGKANNTIVHECVHWALHRKAFLLKSLCGSASEGIACPTYGAPSSRDADWMEWQANTLAPRIQMPMGPFRCKAEEIILNLLDEAGTNDLLDVIEQVIDQLAQFFAVSRLAAKIRMVDAGYEEARGAYVLVDGRYVPAHLVRNDVLMPDETYCIGKDGIAQVCRISPEFRERIQGGAYRYVEAHFVRNRPEYVVQNDDGTVALTPFARRHMENCCLAFRIRAKYLKHEDLAILYTLDKKTDIMSFDFCESYSRTDDWADKEVLKKQREWYLDLGNDFDKALADLYRKRFPRVERADKKGTKRYPYVAAETEVGLRAQEISRIINEKRPPTLPQLFRLLYSFHLPYMISQRILDLSPFKLDLGDPKVWGYVYMLTVCSVLSEEDLRVLADNLGINLDPEKEKDEKKKRERKPQSPTKRKTQTVKK